MNVVAAAATEDLAVFATLTFPIRRSGTQWIGHAKIRRSLLINQLFPVDGAAHALAALPYCHCLYLIRGFLSSTLRKDAVALLILRRQSGARPQMARIFANFAVNLNGIVVLALDYSGRLAESGQLVPTSLYRTRATNAMALCS